MYQMFCRGFCCLGDEYIPAWYPAEDSEEDGPRRIYVAKATLPKALELLAKAETGRVWFYDPDRDALRTRAVSDDGDFVTEGESETVRYRRRDGRGTITLYLLGSSLDLP